MPYPLSMFGTAASASGVVTDQNRVNATAPAWLQGNGTMMNSGFFFTMSLWFECPAIGSSMQIMDTEATTLSGIRQQIWIRNTGQLRIRFANQFATQVTDLESDDPLVPGTYYNLLVAWNSGQSTTRVYLNDVNVPRSGTDTNGGGDWDLTNRWYFFQSRNDSNPIASPRIADLWVANNYLDFNNQNERRKFINADLTPTDLGVDGTNPGVTPRIFFGSDYKAAEWNTGINLGAGNDFDDGSAGWDSFTDV